MKVRELIAHLQSLDPEMPIGLLFPGYDEATPLTTDKLDQRSCWTSSLNTFVIGTFEDRPVRETLLIRGPE